MRRITLLLSLLVLTTVMYAQTEKGKWYVSGSSDLSFSSVTSKFEYDGEEVGEGSDISQFNIKPSIGYFIADGLVLALSLDVETSKQDDYKSNSFMVGPMLKYYFGSSNVKPFIQGDIMFGSQTEDDGVDEAKLKTSGWDLGGGVAIFVNEYISVDLGLGYARGSITNKDDDKQKMIVKGLAFNGGFSLYF